MNITVLGLWHLGCVTAACCGRHHAVTGLDFDAENILRLTTGKAPLSEPGLDDLLAEGLSAGRLQFSFDPASACANADVLWVAYDTPVDEDDVPDPGYVIERFRRCVPHLRRGTLVILSSQLPVGTCRNLENEFATAGLRFACLPENLRLGKALTIFQNPDRIIAGVRTDADREQVATLLRPFSENIIWMRPESAEMTKHSINAFLALSISFMNEVARLCEQTGADAREVEQGLKSESRIGPKAYLSPGSAFAGGTLARDISTLTAVGQHKHLELALIPAIKASNDEHKLWADRKLTQLLGDLAGKTVAVLGLTYKPGTDTLRRSSAVELCQRLHAAGAVVKSFDPAVKTVPPELAPVIGCCDSAFDALVGADAVVVCTEWPEFRTLPWTELISSLRGKRLLDANRFLAKELQTRTEILYVTVGSGERGNA